MGILADPLAPGPDATGGELAGADVALLRRTRLRLTAWSTGLTLVVLVVLGTALYAAVASSLAARGSALLETRAQDVGRQHRPVRGHAVFTLDGADGAGVLFACGN